MPLGQGCLGSAEWVEVPMPNLYSMYEEKLHSREYTDRLVISSSVDTSRIARPQRGSRFPAAKKELYGGVFSSNWASI